MELLRVDTISEAREKILPLATPLLTRSESIPLAQARGRILARPVLATDNVPGFTRSTVDGYAVVSADTAGAGESIPVVLSVAGTIEMGEAASVGVPQGIGRGQCASVPTGGMLPKGADSVVMLEYTEGFGQQQQQLGIYRAVAPGENVIHAGDDMTTGTTVLPAGTRLCAPEIGACSAVGATEVTVFSAAPMALISTGDELVAPSTQPQAGQVRDINSAALRAQAQAAGYQVTETSVLPDVEDELCRAVQDLMQRCAFVVLSGGSSQGAKDSTARVIDRVADAGVLIHGLAVKPGKPTVIGFDKASQTLLVGLPGHPLSAMMVFEVLLSWLSAEATKVKHPLPLPAKLTRDLATAAGRDTLQLVSLAWIDGELRASPLHTRSGLVSGLVAADGYLWIDRNTEGLRAGTQVAVNRLTV
jgi:molybdopterin molybdotransferase